MIYVTQKQHEILEKIRKHLIKVQSTSHECCKNILVLNPLPKKKILIFSIDELRELVNLIYQLCDCELLE